MFPIQVPPLRERQGDLPLLAMFFVQHFAKKLGRKVTQISEETMRRLANYSWPGNIRELQNVIERAVILSPGPVLAIDQEFKSSPAANPPTAAQAPATERRAPSTPASLEDAERHHIESVLGQAGWVIEGDRGAAKILKLHPNTLRSRMKKLGIQRPA